MKKNTILSKKWLLLPKIVSMVGIVGVSNSLLDHNKKEENMVTESSKSYRYEKIADAITERVHQLADLYKASNTNNEVKDIDQESYNWACQKQMKDIKATFGDGPFYWIVEIILQDSFDYQPEYRNPYALHKRKEPDMEIRINPYKLMIKEN